MQKAVIPGGSVRALNATLEAVITTAWQIPDFELADVPSWVKSERWDIETPRRGRHHCEPRPGACQNPRPLGHR